MTRFARAKGSKASNERVPDDATPWEVMKEQLMKSKKEGEEAQKRLEAEQQRIQNYENFLRERKTQKKPATWCDFPEAEKPSTVMQNISKQTVSSKKKNIKKYNNFNSDNVVSEEHLLNANESLNSEVVKKNKTNKQKQLQEYDPEDVAVETNNKKKRKLVNEQQLEAASEEVTKSNNATMKSAPPKKKKKKNKKKLPQVPQEESAQVQNSQLTSPSKNKKNKKPKSASNVEDNTSNAENTNQSGVTNLDSTVSKQKNNKKRTKNKNTPNQNITDNSESNENTQKNFANKQNKEKANKKKKFIDGVPVRRKEITERSFQLIINGKEIELVRFDGFPIMKKDAERLTELKNSMLKKGIPKSEVQRTMKLERRRAEKALARLKKDVCYNCRKGGHNLSDCPELKTKIPGVDGADGVCFKCGSTEHRQSECKVQRDKEFRFATCFICKEAGHIARQCPDNPKGLYPNGGCCKLCGDVTHLRKDCPTQNNKKEDSAIKLHTLDTNDGVEDIGLQNTSTAVPQEATKKPKKIKF